MAWPTHLNHPPQAHAIHDPAGNLSQDDLIDSATAPGIVAARVANHARPTLPPYHSISTYSTSAEHPLTFTWLRAPSSPYELQAEAGSSLPEVDPLYLPELQTQQSAIGLLFIGDKSWHTRAWATPPPSFIFPPILKAPWSVHDNFPANSNFAVSAGPGYSMSRASTGVVSLMQWLCQRAAVVQSVKTGCDFTGV